KLQEGLTKLKTEYVTTPVVSVTGTVLASLLPGKDDTKDTWQFATPELLTAFADWQRAVADITFQEGQLKLIKTLNEKRIAAQQKVVARLEKLVFVAKTDTEKDLHTERTNLILFQVQGRTEIDEAEKELRLARRTEATLARQLQQAGLEPKLLRSAAAEGDIVVAEVPERAIRDVKLDRTCVVRFYAFPERLFTGKVSSIAPVVTKDKRVASVQFIVQDPDKLLRPGMFAEIGIDTDKRPARLMPADGVLHVDGHDYALVEAKKATWKITEVRVGELRGSNV